tara:strand:- start:3264 stop:4694 length:1431 start_codon:yes stop_codon:yes gene_type:complete
MTDEELLEARSQSSGMQRQDTLDAINRLVAAAPQAEPAPPPEPINVPPMLERPMGTIPEALGRPSGEVVHPRDRALIEGFKQRDPAYQQRMRTPVRRRETVPAILAKLHPDRHMGATETEVLGRFGGSEKYNAWWNSLPEQFKPRNYAQASAVADRLGVPRKAGPPRASKQERIDAHMATVPEVRQVPSRQDRIDAYMATVPEVREVGRKVEVPGGAIEGPRLFNGSRDDGQGLLHPVSADVFRSSSSGIRTYDGETRAHKGDDYAPVEAGTKPSLVAMTDGKVIYSKDYTTRANRAATGNSAGHRMEIEYGQGNDRFRVRYFHLDQAPTLHGEKGRRGRPGYRPASTVKRGDTIGIMGATGGTSSGVHLHAELRRYNPQTKEFDLHDFDKFLESGGKGSLSDTAYDTTRRSIAGHRPGHEGHAADHPGHSAQEEVLEKFGGKMLGEGSYNEWWESFPENERPGGWEAALRMLEEA